jgi:hypothetical protein
VYLLIIDPPVPIRGQKIGNKDPPVQTPLKEPEFSMNEQAVRNRRLFENVKVLKIHGLP